MGDYKNIPVVSGGGGGTDHALLSNLSYASAAHTGFQPALGFTPVQANGAIFGATKTKIAYDSKGLVTSGADATTADIADSLNARYCTDAEKTVIGNTSNTNTGDETNATIKTKLGAATGLVDGYLTSANWSTFNGKQDVPNYRLISADYEMTLTDNIIVVQGSAGNITVTLPTVAAAYKRILTIINETSNTVTCQARGADVFYTGSGSVVLATLGESMQITAFSGWNIISKFVP